MARFDFDFFSRDQQSVAQIVPAASVFTLLNRRVRIPAECMALAWSSAGQPSIVHSGAELEADGLTRIMVVRAGPFALDYQYGGLISSDAHEFSANLRLAVHLVPERTELGIFQRRVMAGGERLTLSQLLRHCDEPVRVCAAAFCKAHKAEDLLLIETSEKFDAAIAEAFKAFGFESGLSLGPDVRAEFRSPAYAEIVRQRKSDDVRRQRLEADATMRQASHQARAKHMESLAEITQRVRAMAASEAGLSVPELMRSFDPAQRGELYGGLLQDNQSSRTARSILLVAGDEIISVDAASKKVTSRRAMDAKYGPLRSVRIAAQGDTQRVLVGARNGVHILDANLNPQNSFGFEPARALRGGINAVAIRDDDLFATHSEVGLLHWKTTGGKEHCLCLSSLISGAKAIREVQTDDAGMLWFAADTRVIGFTSPTDPAPIVLDAFGDVSAMLAVDGYVYGGLSNGTICRWPTSPPHDRELIRGKTGDSVESLDWLAGGGIPRLLVADKRPMIELRVAGDSYAAEYRAPQPIRWAWCSGLTIFGVNDRRDQLLCWDMDNAAAPIAMVPIAVICGHIIQDAALL